MSKPDRFKEEIGWLKALCALLIAGLTSLVVWLVQNYGAANRVAWLIAISSLPALAAGIAAVIARLYRCFKILEAL